MNNSKQLLSVSRLYYRQMSQAAQAEVVAPRFNKLKEIQQKFQIDDGTPVHLKGGVGDKILFMTTTALTFLGLGLSFETFYKLTFK